MDSPFRLRQEAVKDGIGQGLAEVVMPELDRELTGDQGGAEARAVLDEFQKVIALGVVSFWIPQPSKINRWVLASYEWIYT